MTLRRIFLWAALAAVLGLLILGLVRAFASPLEKIRTVLQTMVAGFNERKLAAVLGGVDSGFIDATKGYGFGDLQSALQFVFMTEFDAETKRFLYRARLDESDLKIEIHDAGKAEVTASVVIESERGGQTQLFWPLRVRGLMAETENGWVWTRTEEVNHEERRRR